MNSYSLLIFEGHTERHVTDNLKKYFLESNNNTLVYASFGHNIYQLSQEIQKDSGLDLFELVCEVIDRRNDKNREIFEIDRENISDIYLFFDYDPHTTNANNEDLLTMLSTFNNSNDNGMLYINYPMLEAVRHIKEDNFDEITFTIDDLVNYKRFLTCRSNNLLVNVNESFHNWGLYTKEIWKKIIEINLGRANNLVNECNSLPEKIITQDALFECQKQKHIIPKNRVSVISAFPLMLHNYYGSNLWKKL